jgi:integrase
MQTLTTKEVAIDLGLNIRSIQRYINQGFLPAIRQKGAKGQAEYVVEYSGYHDWKNRHFKGLKLNKINKANRLNKSLNLPQVKELASEWLNSLKLGTFNGRVYSSKTIETYRYQIAQYWKLLSKHAPKPYFSHVNMLYILSQIPVENFASRQKLFDASWCFMKYLCEQDLMTEAEMLKIKKLKPKRFIPAKKVTYREDQIEAILKANKETNGNDAYDKLLTETIVLVFANTGLRVSELCNLKFEDIDLEQKTLYVWLGKGNKNRRIGLNNKVIAVLEKYLLKRREKGYSEYLFVTRHSEQLKPNTLRHRWRRLSNKVGFKITNHGFRRSFVTINNRKGRSLVDLQIACAHSDISMTRSYCMTSEDEVVNAMQNWD